MKITMEQAKAAHDALYTKQDAWTPNWVSCGIGLGEDGEFCLKVGLIEEMDEQRIYEVDGVKVEYRVTGPVYFL